VSDFLAAVMPGDHALEYIVVVFVGRVGFLMFLAVTVFGGIFYARAEGRGKPLPRVSTGECNLQRTDHKGLSR